MILPLRRWHRRWTSVLAVIMPILVWGALAARPAPLAPMAAPMAGSILPDDSSRQGDTAARGKPQELGSWPDLWRTPGDPKVGGGRPLPLLTRIVARDGSTGAARALEVVANEPPAAAPAWGPDPLLYWSPGSDAGTTAGPSSVRLPPDAHLLGPLLPGRPSTLRLPVDARQGGGTLLLYSLAHQRVTGRARLPSLIEPPVIEPQPPEPGEEG